MLQRNKLFEIAKTNIIHAETNDIKKAIQNIFI